MSPPGWFGWHGKIKCFIRFHVYNPSYRVCVKSIYWMTSNHPPPLDAPTEETEGNYWNLHNILEMQTEIIHPPHQSGRKTPTTPKEKKQDRLEAIASFGSKTRNHRSANQPFGGEHTGLQGTNLGAGTRRSFGATKPC